MNPVLTGIPRRLKKVKPRRPVRIVLVIGHSTKRISVRTQSPSPSSPTFERDTPETVAQLLSDARPTKFLRAGRNLLTDTRSGDIVDIKGRRLVPNG